MSESADRHEFAVMWPSGPVARDTFQPVERPQQLDGETVAFVWDYIFRGDEMWDVVKEELRRRYPGIHLVDHDEFGNIHSDGERGVLAALPDRLRRRGVSTVLVGVAA